MVEMVRPVCVAGLANDNNYSLERYETNILTNKENKSI